MINRSKMPRQLRAQGGITNVTPREGFFLGGIKKRIRKLIPNEIADIAVKAAPFVAPFQPGIAAAMRGIGRFDQRGSISDALKQGALTFGFGKGVGALGGAQSDSLFGGQTFTKEGFKKGPIGRLFQRPLTEGNPNFTGGDANKGKLLGTSSTPATTEKGVGFIKDAAKYIDNLPIIKDLPPLVQQQIIVGGVTGAATYVYEKFLAEEPPQEEGETYEQYMARRKENVGGKMRTYFDNYFKFDKDYSSMTDEQKDAFVARYNLARGGRVGYQTGGITMGRTLQQNVAANRQQAANIQAMLNAARAKAGLPTVQAPQQTAPSGISSLSTPAQTSAPAQTAAPAPSITTPSSTPTQTQAPTMQQITSAMLSSGNPMASSGSSVMPQTISSQMTAPATTSKTYTIPKQTGVGFSVDEEGRTLAAPMGPMMTDPLQVFSGLNQQQISELPEQDFLALEKRFDALPQSEKDNIDKFITTSLDKQAQQFLAKEKADEIKYRQPDGSPGNMGMYVDAVQGIKATRPDVKLTGNETLTDLQKIIYPEYFNPDGSYMTDDQYNQKFGFNPGSTVTFSDAPLNLDPRYTMSSSNIESFLRANPQMNTTRGRYYAGRNQFDVGGRVGFSKGSDIKIKLKQIGYEDTLLDTMTLKELIDLLDSEEGTFTDQGTYREPAKKGGMPTGIMKTNKAGVMERDYRDKGGFVPVGIKEKADDVPAMLSKNEFVMTANAVRGAGGGSIEKGAQRMYDTMKRLEKRVV